MRPGTTLQLSSRTALFPSPHLPRKTSTHLDGPKQHPGQGLLAKGNKLHALTDTRSLLLELLACNIGNIPEGLQFVDKLAPVQLLSL